VESTPRFPKIDIELPFFGSVYNAHNIFSASPHMIAPKKNYELDQPTKPSATTKVINSSLESSLDTSQRDFHLSSQITLPPSTSQRKAPRIPSYILPTNNTVQSPKQNFKLEPSQDTKGSAPSSVNNSSKDSTTRSHGYPPLPENTRLPARPPKLDHYRDLSRELKHHNFSYESDSSNAPKSLNISSISHNYITGKPKGLRRLTEIDKPIIDPEAETLQIERRLRYFEQQKQQMHMYKLEHRQLLEKLTVYEQTNNAEEINKIQQR
jgi:hypothetical protein